MEVDIFTWSRYLRCLRTIVLCSADSHYDKVKEFLRLIVRHDSIAASQAFRDDYQYLVRLAPDLFVDFALDHLTVDSPRLSNKPCDVSDHNVHLGLNRLADVNCPSYVSGPFLYLLQQNEAEGLRLILALTNFATKQWADREKTIYKRDPMRFSIKVNQQENLIYGDYSVYQWFRPQSDITNAVKSSLMALEYWLEQEIASSGSASDLFTRLLTQTNSVSVLAVCISVSLSYPEKCLRALVPILNQSILWIFDIKRLSEERIEFINYLHDYADTLYELQKERELRPQRFRDLRFLIRYYLEEADGETKLSYLQAVASMCAPIGRSWNVPVLGPTDIAVIQAVARGRHTFIVPGDYSEQDINDLFEPQATIQRLRNWSYQTLVNAPTGEVLLPATVWSMQQGLRKHDDFRHVISLRDLNEAERLEAIAGAMAALVVKERDWLIQTQHIEEVKETLVNAAGGQYEDYTFGRSEGMRSLDPRYCAAALGTLTGSQLADGKLEDMLLELLCYPYQKLTATIIEQIGRSETSTDTFCMTALRLLIQLWTEESSWLFEKDRPFQPTKISLKARELLIGCRKPPKNDGLPHITYQEFMVRSSSIFIAALQQLPKELYTTKQAQLLQLGSELFSWTESMIQTQDPKSADAYHWFREFSRWLIILQHEVGDISGTFLLPNLKRMWTSCARFVEAYLSSLITDRINIEGSIDSSLEQWTEITKWVCHAENPPTEIVGLLVFIRTTRLRISRKLDSIAQFEPLLEQWVSRFESDPDAFTHMVSFFLHIQPRVRPELVIDCILRFLENSHSNSLWSRNSNGDRAIECLLQVVEDSDEKGAELNHTVMSKLSKIVSSLADSGVSEAGLLMSAIEHA